ncbi:MAG: DUF4838 domain-containing protein, partial [Lachnospiraceae bacterium]|nr:DUF4838 domain-containing protein [Lachnospiraceae bacterium]
LNVSVSAVSKWERGESLPDVAMIVPIAAFFAVSTDDLLGNVEKSGTPKPEETELPPDSGGRDPAEKYVIADNGRSDWFIVVDRDADEVVRYAAEQLNKYLYRITGALVPYHSNLCARRGPEIRLGFRCRPDGEDGLISLEGLSREGFRIRTTGDNILIASPSSRGILYGVYTFLEKICGCRWFSSRVTRIPRRRRLAFGDLDIAETPAFECRDVYWRDAFDGAFASHNKINSGKADISFKQGGMEKFFNFHHAMFDLVPPDRYFDKHPEYFSEINGERVKKQLCLSNPEVVKIAAAQVKKWIRDNPDCKIFSIAQNDGGGYCTCPECRALDEAEGSPSASIIRFSNAVAGIVCAEYPDVLLHTFAYHYSRRAPKTLKPHKNIIVRLCDIECSFSKPLEYYYKNEPDSTEARFVDDLKSWSDITDHLYIWDYCTNFRHYLLPFPNLASLQENIRLFRRYNVKGMFTEGNFSHGGGGAMAELEAYLQAKLFWDPDIDLEETIDDFLDGYFGAGAPWIRKYLDLMQEAVEPYKMGIYSGADAPFLTDELLEKCDALFQSAFIAAENDEVRERVDRARLAVTYAKLVRLPLDAPGRDALIDGFGNRLKEYGVSEISERAYIDWSLEKMKTSRFNTDREGRFNIYYRM